MMMKKLLFSLLFLLILTACSEDPKVIREQSSASTNTLLAKNGDVLYIANIDVNTVSIVDPKTKEVKDEIPVGKEPRQLALSPDEKTLYVSTMYSNQIDVIDLQKKKVTDSIPTENEPFGLVTSADGATLYVANYRSSSVSVINLQEKKTTKTIQVDERPRTLTMTKDGKKMYVPHYLSGKISVIDIQKNTVSSVIELANSPDQNDPKVSQGIPNKLENFIISPDGKTAWVPHLVTNVDTPINFEETVFPAISVIDLETDKELVDQRKELFEEINVVDVDNETLIVSNPYDVAFDPEGKKAYAIMAGSEDLVVFDLTRGGNATQVLRRIPGDNPRGIAIAPDGSNLYVHNAMSHDLTTIETGGDSAYARAKLVDENLPLIKEDSLSPLVREGKQIFYSGNSDDYATDITGNNWMSCASCHADGEINGLTLTTPKGLRNVPSNVKATETGLFLWDGSRDDFTDYILTIQGEMGGMLDYDAGEELPNDVQHMYDALFAYLDQPDSFPVPKSPYRSDNGNLTDQAQLGKELFEGAGNCLSCHSGSQFTNSASALNADGKLSTDNTDFLYDIGTANETDQSSDGDARAHFQNPRTPAQFDVPTLLGVWATAPYLHDGSAKTIDEAIERHEYEAKPQLAEGEVAAIAEYVRSID